MIEKWREGYEVVKRAAQASREADTAAKRITAALFYRVFNAMTDTKISPSEGDFRLMDRRVIEALRLFAPERKPVHEGSVRVGRLPANERRVPGLPGAKNLGHHALERVAAVELRARRHHVVHDGPAPHLDLSGLGALSVRISFYAVFLIVRVMIIGVEQPGYASLMVTILFFGGIQFIPIGVMGEYIGRIYQEVKRRPLYIVDKTVGIDTEDVP